MKLRLLAVISATAGVLAAGCGGTAEEPDAAPTAPQLSTVVPRTLTACTDAPYAPFEFEEDGRLAGIDIDLVRHMAQDFGLAPAFEDVNFDLIFQALDEGRCDLVASSVSITPERQQKMLFSEGYFAINQGLLVRKEDSDAYRRLANLDGRKVGVLEGTTGQAYATAHFKGGPTVAFDNWDALTEALATKQVDAVIQDFPVASYYAQKTQQSTVVATFTDVQREDYAFAVKAGNTALRDAVNAALSRIREDGRYDATLRKYLGGN